MADCAQLARVLAAQRARGPRLAGAIHAAGVLADATVSQLDLVRLRLALAPKVLGAWQLHTLTQNDALDFMVFYSSAAAVLGSPGQANYAAANSFLDALAWTRRAQGRPALSINWGPWAEVGLAAASDRRGARLAQRGLASLTPTRGLAALGHLLAESPTTQRAIMPFDASRWAEANPAVRLAPLFDELREARVHADQAPTEAAGQGFLSRLRAATPGSPRRELLEGFVRDQLARVLGLDASRIGAAQPFQALGLDSLLALEFRNRLEAALGISLSATLAWNYPTLASLAPHLASCLALPLTAETVEKVESEDTEQTVQTEADAQDDMAAELADLSDAELAELLAGELDEVQTLLDRGHA